MMHARALIAAMILAAASTACHRADKPVPRREAYARINPYAHVYTPVGSDSLPVSLMAARDADVAVSRGGNGAWWLTIAYPRYRASIYATILQVPADSLPERMANRMERLALEMGSARPQITEWTRGAYTGITATAPWLLTTPAKMIAHDGNHIVSATVYCEGYADADQLAPVASELITDLRHILPDNAD